MVLTPTPRGDDGSISIDGFAALSIDREAIVQSKLARNGDSSDEDGAGPRKQTTRGYEIVFKTEDQLHRFNCPFQLGLESSDSPESASISQHAVKVGDLVIAGSDGLWDNLFDSDVRRLADESDDVTELAFIIATAASRRASKTRGARATPFAVDASEAGIMFEGGKMDDITVIVGKVVRADRQPSSPRARL
jgi:protein phosphatase PTC7